MSKGPFNVQVTVVETREYSIGEANTPEEAETIAEQYFLDGEEGTVVESDIIETQAYQIKDSDAG